MKRPVVENPRPQLDATVPQGSGVPNQAPKPQNFNFYTYIYERFVTGQGFLVALIPYPADNRIIRRDPLALA